MSACEPCWNEAYRQSRLLGGSQVDHYRRLLAALDHHSPDATSTPGRTWRPGDKAQILFRDGVRRPAELSRGFIWTTADGAHQIAAEGGFDAYPLLHSTAPITPTPTTETRESAGESES